MLVTVKQESVLVSVHRLRLSNTYVNNYIYMYSPHPLTAYLPQLPNNDNITAPNRKNGIPEGTQMKGRVPQFHLTLRHYLWKHHRLNVNWKGNIHPAVITLIESDSDNETTSSPKTSQPDPQPSLLALSAEGKFLTKEEQLDAIEKTDRALQTISFWNQRNSFCNVDN